jgi:phosphoribosylanthranilate isomerase
VYVKICGVKTTADAELCVAAGADAIGINFYSASVRYVPLELAAEIARAAGDRVQRVGIFVNPERDEVETAFARGIIDVAQFHGAETPAFCEQFAGRYMKALRLGDEASLSRLDLYACELFVVDADVGGGAGRGVRANWSIAERAGRRRTIILAGGLTPDNVADAIAAVKPFGVDVASGVEKHPGEKDPGKVRAFVTRAKETRP